METEEDELIFCVCCMGKGELYDLFEKHESNDHGQEEIYGQMLESCFNIKIPEEMRTNQICSNCIDKMKEAIDFKEKTLINFNTMMEMKVEEYLDESILEEGEYLPLKEYVVEIKSKSAKNSEKDSSGSNYEYYVSDSEEDDKVEIRKKQPYKLAPHLRPKCKICGKDFSQRCMLYKHMRNDHGKDVSKRKAYICPLCDARVHYGTGFSEHLHTEHKIREEIDDLIFESMDEFKQWKISIQSKTKTRFRKTTSTKQVTEGLKSHYMCSQSGEYIYQGKGIRPAPLRQIYKTGKACPAHMVVTETDDGVKVTFYKTHVGHGECPYFQPKSPKKREPKEKTQQVMVKIVTNEKSVKKPSETIEFIVKEELVTGSSQLICNVCGVEVFNGELENHLKNHCNYQCLYCDEVFHAEEEKEQHQRYKHHVGPIYQNYSYPRSLLGHMNLTK